MSCLRRSGQSAPRSHSSLPLVSPESPAPLPKNRTALGLAGLTTTLILCACLLSQLASHTRLTCPNTPILTVPSAFLAKKNYPPCENQAKEKCPFIVMLEFDPKGPSKDYSMAHYLLLIRT